jgi:hypothetical protein
MQNPENREKVDCNDGFGGEFGGEIIRPLALEV